MAHPAAAWSIDAVCMWLGGLDVTSDEIASFRRERISGKALLELTDADLKTDLGVSLGGRKLIAEELKKLGPGGGGGANDPKNAAGQVAQESSSVVPEWSSPPATGAVGAFAELQQNKGPPLMSRVVTLGGRQVPLVAVTGGAVAVILLLLLVVAIVPNSCDGVDCGKFGACQNGDCLCQSGYSSVDKQACAVDNCYRIDCGSYGICQPNERREEHRVVSSWTCECSGGYSGTHCENDPCHDVECGRWGSCRVEGSNGVCQCDAGWSGASCDRKVSRGA